MHDGYESSDFLNYLMVHSCGIHILNMLDLISNKCDIYIYSGVIRDFFLEKDNKIRDLDLVIVGENDIQESLEKIFPSALFQKNYFGGLKILSKTLTIDVWPLQKTWGLIREKLVPNKENLLKTAFFNFSSVLFDYKQKKFYKSNAFEDFLKKKTIDIVYEDNPNEPLCVVNTIYYSELLDMPLSRSLSFWLKNHYVIEMDYSLVQLNHFGEIIYSNKEIYSYIHKLTSY